VCVRAKGERKRRIKIIREKGTSGEDEKEGENEKRSTCGRYKYGGFPVGMPLHLEILDGPPPQTSSYPLHYIARARPCLPVRSEHLNLI